MGLRKTPAALAALGAAAALAIAGCGSSGSSSAGTNAASAAAPAQLGGVRGIWYRTNEFKAAKYTLPIYVQYFYGRGSVDWGGIMAASTLFTVPVMIFFLIVQRRMTGGLVAGAVKG